MSAYDYGWGTDLEEDIKSFAESDGTYWANRDVELARKGSGKVAQRGVVRAAR